MNECDQALVKRAWEANAEATEGKHKIAMVGETKGRGGREVEVAQEPKRRYQSVRLQGAATANATGALAIMQAVQYMPKTGCVGPRSHHKACNDRLSTPAIIGNCKAIPIHPFGTFALLTASSPQPSHACTLARNMR